MLKIVRTTWYCNHCHMITEQLAQHDPPKHCPHCMWLATDGPKKGYCFEVTDHEVEHERLDFVLGRRGIDLKRQTVFMAQRIPRLNKVVCVVERLEHQRYCKYCDRVHDRRVACSAMNKARRQPYDNLTTKPFSQKSLDDMNSVILTRLWEDEQERRHQ